MHRLWVATLMLAGCFQTPSSDGIALPDPINTPHLEVHGATRYQAERYERLVVGIEDLLQFRVAPLRMHQQVVPRCDGTYCVEDGVVNVYCDDLRIECVPALVTAIVDQTPDVLPLVFRDALIDVLAGGFGHGDVLDHAVDRSRVDLRKLVDDDFYQSSRLTVEAEQFGDLTWMAGTTYPSADFVRFVLDELGGSGALRALRQPTSQDWGMLATFDAAVAAWRASPTRTGRMHRLPLVECDPAYSVSLGSVELPVMVQGVLFAPDLLNSISRFGVANFSIDQRSDVAVTVTSSVDGNPFFRVESCGSRDPGPFMNMYENISNNSVNASAIIEADTYFVVAGSWTGESYEVAERPEQVLIQAVPSN